MKRPKPWYRSKSIWMGVLGTVAGVGSLAVPGTKVGSTIAIVSGVATAILRTQTATAIEGTAAAEE